MKHSTFIFIILTVSICVSYAQLPANSEFRALHFPTTDYGYIVGDGGLVVTTTNAGVKWQQISLGTGRTQNLQSVFFLSEGVGFIGGDDGRLYITIDGGANVNLVSFPELRIVWQINSIYFTGPDEGWFLAIDTLYKSTQGRVYHSSDYGSSWKIELSSTVGYFNGMSFQEGTNRGVVVGDTTTRINYNGGSSVWKQADTVTFPSTPVYTNQSMYGVFFAPSSSDLPTTAYACGYGNAGTSEPTIYLRSDDAGSTWNYLAQRDIDKTYGTALKLLFADPLNGIAIGNNATGSFISRTTDGEHFVPVLFNYSSKTKLRDITGIGPSLWVAGSDCFLAHSSDFGTTWQTMSLCPVNEVDDTQQPLQFSLHQNYPNPFSAGSSTTIEFTISPMISSHEKNSEGNVRCSLRVFDALGRKVTEIFNSDFEPGSYSTIFQSHLLSAGMYFYQLKIGRQIITRHLMITK